MRFRAWTMGLTLLTTLAACGGREETRDNADIAPGAVAKESKAAATPDTALVSTGSVVFRVDGMAKEFDVLPTRGNTYLPLASSIVAKPSASSTEKLTITFLSLDLRKVSAPADLPAPKDFTKLDVRAAAATIGYSYTDEEGSEWAGPGRIHVKSFSPDGMLEASFDSVSLPHTDEKLPSIVLDHGVVRATLRLPM